MERHHFPNRQHSEVEDLLLSNFNLLPPPPAVASEQSGAIAQGDTAIQITLFRSDVLVVLAVVSVFLLIKLLRTKTDTRYR